MRTFIEQLLESIYKPEDIEITTRTVVKDSGEKIGVVLRKRENNIAPTIYVEDIYDKYKRGMLTFQEAKDEFVLRVVSALRQGNPCGDDVIRKLTDWDQVAPMIRMCAACKNAPEQFLQGTPFVPVADLAIYFRVVLGHGEGVFSTVVNSQMLSFWEKTITEVFEQAQRNSLDDYDIMDIGKTLMGIEDDRMPVMLALSNKDKIHGAGMIASYPVLEKICRVMNTTKLILLPSSIHEIIVLSDSNQMDVDGLIKLIKRANSTEVPPEEQLSDIPYTFDLNSRKVTVYRG